MACFCHTRVINKQTKKHYLLQTRAAKGRTNVELREQFILADGVSQSMAAFTPRRSAAAAANSNQNGSGSTPPYMSGQGPIVKVNNTHTKCHPIIFTYTNTNNYKKI